MGNDEQVIEVRGLLEVGILRRRTERGWAVRVRLSGELDHATVGPVRGVFAEAVHEARGGHVVVDASGLTYAGAAAVDALVVLAMAGRERATPVVLREPTDHLVRLLRLTRVDGAFAPDSAIAPGGPIVPDRRVDSDDADPAPA